ncbi:MAG: tetratricopeptide repeat protein [Chitinivibrionales bacterium]|nr:tetratricopeptide repeat protein [Chitinivibrionales bacterium]
MPMHPVLRPVLIVALLFSAVLPLQAESLLQEAWREYNYQNWHRADQIFSQIIDESDIPDDVIQAKIGEAMIVHFKIPGGRPGKAIGMYEEILQDVGPSHAVSPNLNLLMGRAYMALRKPDIASAKKHFEKILTDNPGSIEAHEAALEMAYIKSYVHDYNYFMDAINFLQKYCTRYPENPLAGTMMGLCANLALDLKEYEHARSYLIAWDSIGVMNVRYKSAVVYQIARMSEEVLGDTATAITYYQKLAREYESDNRLYFSQLRLKALGGEIPGEDIVSEDLEMIAAEQEETSDE